MTDSFEFTLNSPLTKEDWGILADYEYESSNSVTFQTPTGKQVKFIKADILDKIRAEIEGLTYYWCEVNPKTVINDVIEIIDKYRQEG